MLSNHLIIVAFSSALDDGCDYALQTLKILSASNRVVGLVLHEPYTWKSVISDVLRGKQSLVRRQNGYELVRLLYMIPGQRFQVIQSLNLLIGGWLLRLWLAFRNQQSKIFWFFEPYQTSELLGVFNNYLTVYDCVDFYSQLSDQIAKNEASILERVKLVAVNSPVLLEHHRSKHNQVFQVPLGFADELFRKPKNRTQNTRVVGYVGGINYRLDFPLLLKLIKKLPEYTFRFVGPMQTEGSQVLSQISKLKALPNTEFIPPVPKHELASYIAEFDVALIPYDVSAAFNRYSYPMKLPEYFALQKPVIATMIETLLPLQPLVMIGSNAEQFAKHIRSLEKNPLVQEQKKHQRAWARQQAWSKKINAISSLIEKYAQNSTP